MYIYIYIYTEALMAVAAATMPTAPALPLSRACSARGSEHRILSCRIVWYSIVSYRTSPPMPVFPTRPARNA